MKKIVFGLVDQVKKIGATDGHFTANNIQHTKGLTSVVSVYDGVKPAHMVLSELKEWAEESNEDVKCLIEKIENDMTWNEENPV